MTWDQFWESISVAQLAVWIVAILALVAFFAKGWPKLRALVKLVDALGTLPQFMTDTAATLEAQDTKIGEIHHEVKYNNGSSVKDAIGRIEVGVAGIYTRLDSADVDRAELREDLEHTRPAVARKRSAKPTTTKE